MLVMVVNVARRCWLMKGVEGDEREDTEEPEEIGEGEDSVLAEDTELVRNMFFNILFSSFKACISCIIFMTMPSCSFSMASKAFVSMGVPIGEMDSVAMLLLMLPPLPPEMLLLLLLDLLQLLRFERRFPVVLP